MAEQPTTLQLLAAALSAVAAAKENVGMSISLHPRDISDEAGMTELLNCIVGAPELGHAEGDEDIEWKTWGSRMGGNRIDIHMIRRVTS